MHIHYLLTGARFFIKNKSNNNSFSDFQNLCQILDFFIKSTFERADLYVPTFFAAVSTPLNLKQDCLTFQVYLSWQIWQRVDNNTQETMNIFQVWKTKLQMSLDSKRPLNQILRVSSIRGWRPSQSIRIQNVLKNSWIIWHTITTYNVIKQWYKDLIISK